MYVVISRVDLKLMCTLDEEMVIKKQNRSLHFEWLSHTFAIFSEKMIHNYRGHFHSNPKIRELFYD